MVELCEKQLKFSFPKDWQASQFDNWSFYRKQFMKFGSAKLTCKQCQHERQAGMKAVDFLAIDREKTCWLIEVKDYRKTCESNFAFLADVVSLKVRDTLACLVAARIIQRANVLQKLKSLVKSIDAHPLVVDLGSLNQVGWNVTQIKSK